MKRTFAVLMSMLGLVGCGKNAAPDGAAPAADGAGKVVEVTNYPLAFFAERLAGGIVPVSYRAPTEGDPAFWKPSDADVAAMQQAGVILTNGATYEKWLSQVSLPQSLIVDTSAGFSDAYITVKEAATHSHGPGEAHAHGGTAFTTWMDLTQATQQLLAVQTVIEERAPESERPKVAERGAGLQAALSELDQRMLAVAKRMGDTPLLASHPVYQYWARRYGLNVKELHWEPDGALQVEHWQELGQTVDGHPAQWMIWEGEPLPESVAKLRDRGIVSLIYDPCGNRPDEGDFLTVMEQNIAALEKAFP